MEYARIADDQIQKDLNKASSIFEDLYDLVQPGGGG